MNRTAQRRTPPERNMSRPEFYQRRLDKLIDVLGGPDKERKRILHNYPGVGKEKRTYSDYEAYFGIALKQFFNRGDAGLVSFLKQFRNPRVFDEGCGKGRFLAGLKRDNPDLTLHATALTLRPDLVLSALKRKGIIDALEIDASQLFIPKNKYHLITSLASSFYYSADPAVSVERENVLGLPKSLRPFATPSSFKPSPLVRLAFMKNMLLKYAYALEKGGLLLIGFNYGERRATNAINRLMNSRNARIKSGLPPNELTDEEKDFIHEKMSGIIPSLEKRGFRAKIFDIELYGFPQNVLVVQRTK